MAEVVLVHGIAQENRTPDEIHDEWMHALAEGLAKLPGAPDQLPTVDAAVAYYGDLYKRAGAMGAGGMAEFTADEQVLADELAREWMERVVERGTDDADRAVAEAALAEAEGAQAQGAGAVAGRALTAISRIKWFARAGMAVAQRLPGSSLWQVSRYFTDDELRAEAVARVQALIDEDTKIVIGHSLGSVVAFEALCTTDSPLPLFVTIGSPLGLHTIVLERLRPQPPGIPHCVRWWVNIADRDDVVAADPHLEQIFRGEGPGAVLEAAYTVDNGKKPHFAGFYLAQPEVCRPIDQVIVDGAGPD